jgi:hypothetical protein
MNTFGFVFCTTFICWGLLFVGWQIKKLHEALSKEAQEYHARHAATRLAVMHSLDRIAGKIYETERSIDSCFRETNSQIQTIREQMHDDMHKIARTIARP